MSDFIHSVVIESPLAFDVEVFDQSRVTELDLDADDYADNQPETIFIEDETQSMQVLIQGVGAQGPQGAPGQGVNIIFSTVAPTISDPGAIGDLWVVTA